MTPANPLTSQQKPPQQQQAIDLMLGGLPAAANGGGQGQTALAAMLGPGGNLSPYLKMGGVQAGEQLDEMEMNPMNAWF